MFCLYVLHLKTSGRKDRKISQLCKISKPLGENSKKQTDVYTLTMVKIQVEVFWIVMPCIFAV
jgi:hypothetical protein